MQKLYFLGVPRFERDDQRLTLSAAKAVGLLAYLSINRRPQSRDHLLSLLWAESADEAARKNLRNTLWAIRKALGDDLVNTSGDRLTLSDSAWIDVGDFENGDLDLYCGPFLDGLTMTEAPDFELWMTAERERLGQQFLRLLSRQIEQFRAAGDWLNVIEAARRALAQDPLQESMYRTLMEAFAHRGERAEALRQYDTLQATLHRELGVDPLPETEALRIAILEGQLEAPIIKTPPALPHRAYPGDIPSAPFIGREAECAVLDAELALVKSGQMRVVALTGEMGIGKSRLWREWSVSLSDIPVLDAHCLESTQQLPFAPLVELFSRPACILHSTRSAVAPIWLAELSRFFPELRSRQPDLPVPAMLPPEEERRHVFEAFTQILLADTQNAPLILFIDDVHWADRTTLTWLGYFVNRMRDQPLMLVLSYRVEDAAAPLAHLMAGWAREGVLHKLPLMRLTNDESLALITSMGGDPALAASVQSQSAGNPYFLIELARAGSLHEGIPAVLRDLVRSRLDRLPDSARQILGAAAILQDDFDFASLQRMTGQSEEESLNALDALLNAAVLIEDSSRAKGIYYNFAHPLVANVIQESLSETRRAILNRRAAEVLEASHADQLEMFSGRIAYHYEAAGEPNKAAKYAEIAAKYALRLAASNEAIDFWRKAIQLEPTGDRYLGLGDTLTRQGDDIPGARDALNAALRFFESAQDNLAAAQTCLRIADTYLPSGRMNDARQWVEHGLAYLNKVDDKSAPATLALAEFILGSASMLADNLLAECEDHLHEAARLAVENGLLDLAIRSYFGLGNLYAELGNFPAALNAYRESIRLAHSAENDFNEVLGYNNYAYHALLAGDVEEAREYADTGLALAGQHTLRLPLQYLYSTRGEIALADQQWDEAEKWFNMGIAEAQHYSNFLQVANYYANLGLVARGRGDLDSALMLLETARDGVAKLTAPHLQIKIDLWLTELYLQRGERAAAANALSHADSELLHSKRGALIAWAQRLKEQIGS